MQRLLFLLLALALGACSNHSGAPGPVMEDEGIVFETNAEFNGPRLRVFLTLEDGREVSVNTHDDAISGVAEPSPIPGHHATSWTLSKEVPEGTSLVYALASWNPDNPQDYLMAGWWAEFNGEHPPNLTYQNLEEYSILDGPEFHSEAPAGLLVSGSASYEGPAGGEYYYVPSTTMEPQPFVVDGWEAMASLNADFEAGTISGCVGCTGDFVVRTALVPASRGDVHLDISDFEMHLEAHPYDGKPDFDGGAVQIHHPARQITPTEGSWGGSFSRTPDGDGKPRLVAGFAYGDFEENDGSFGGFFGSFLGLSEAVRDPDPE